MKDSLRELFIKAGFKIVDNCNVHQATALVMTEREFERLVAFFAAHDEQVALKTRLNELKTLRQRKDDMASKSDSVNNNRGEERHLQSDFVNKSDKELEKILEEYNVDVSCDDIECAAKTHHDRCSKQALRALKSWRDAAVAEARKEQILHDYLTLSLNFSSSQEVLTMWRDNQLAALQPTEEGKI